MPVAQVVSWAAVCPRESCSGFSGSIQIFTQHGARELRHLSKQEFLKCVSVLSESHETFIDLERDLILDQVDRTENPAA